MIKFLNTDLNNIMINNEESSCFCIPIDYNMNLFPDDIKRLSPDLYKVFNHIKQQIIQANMNEKPNVIRIGSNDFDYLFVICINNETKLIEYSNFFLSMADIIKYGYTVYLKKEHFNKYVYNFELLEFDLQCDFENSTDIYIVSEPKKNEKGKPDE